MILSTRCGQYSNIPVGCTYVTDPNDSCCRVPQCTVTGSTGQAVTGFNPAGYTGSFTGQGRPQVATGSTSGAVTGYSSTCQKIFCIKYFNCFIFIWNVLIFYCLNKHFVSCSSRIVVCWWVFFILFSTDNCIYKGQIYTQGQTWQDGCDYNCECIDASKGVYRCTDRSFAIILIIFCAVELFFQTKFWNVRKWNKKQLSCLLTDVQDMEQSPQNAT